MSLGDKIYRKLNKLKEVEIISELLDEPRKFDEKEYLTWWISELEEITKDFKAHIQNAEKKLKEMLKNPRLDNHTSDGIVEEIFKEEFGDELSLSDIKEKQK